MPKTPRFSWLEKQYRPLLKSEEAALAENPSESTEDEDVLPNIPKKDVTSILIYWNVAICCLSVIMLTWSILLGYGVVEIGDKHKEAWKTVNAPCEKFSSEVRLKALTSV